MEARSYCNTRKSSRQRVESGNYACSIIIQTSTSVKRQCTHVSMYTLVQVYANWYTHARLFDTRWVSMQMSFCSISVQDGRLIYSRLYSGWWKSARWCHFLIKKWHHHAFFRLCEAITWVFCLRDKYGTMASIRAITLFNHAHTCARCTNEQHTPWREHSSC